ncbi:TIGR03086 family metal-binding protein [Amycolatopsis acidiphila]|uniref:TIGR03086 family protein n=1 Tax=Amycolatopsis acidiphila TaxID=715473 RepID=A0A557ZLX4_9PSEU|nr:TIGR03086 family metal-binding protein [Amycolatopsis acidiphila]TVT12973.1 TIGR03086 family protein [Amycolatopsis acidiphila]UIJ62831.1 TIGR03086 family metal-binding protein [Amycolatopsis acidiphila]GHG64489.1 TIGR03086 family protein [Amycolatopsis acidiphila]
MNLLDAHGEALREFDRTVHRVGGEQWDAPTPCTEWSVRDLVNHLVSEQLWVPHLLAGETIEEVGDRYDGDVLGDDPVGVWEKASAAARESWTAPGATDRQVHLSYGEADAADYGWQMTLDFAVHAWDLATGIGAEQPMADDVAEALLTTMGPQVQAWQGIGLFAPPVPVPESASAPDRLLALVGRDPGGRARS